MQSSLSSTSRQCAAPTRRPSRVTGRLHVRKLRHVTVSASKEVLDKPEVQLKKEEGSSSVVGSGLALGPISLSFGTEIGSESTQKKKSPSSPKKSDVTASISGGLGVALGPISLSYATEFGTESATKDETNEAGPDSLPSIHSMTTEEWRAMYEKDGTVDLWVEEEFNSGSRLMGGRVVHKGGTYGIRTGEGPSLGEAPVHKIRIHDHYKNQIVDVDVPEDRYILWEAEDSGLELPYACRMGCCTACAVRIKEGEMWQPEALGISREFREQGYGLMCVGFPLTDMVLETVSEDEVYNLQFGNMFAALATDPNNSNNVERDDFALEIAMLDE